ncbi:SH3 domain-containing protein [uncultured Chryseobacterium sp.]|uniref:SH3 domain-containing protein n=1 Tax=uncultured Chryseobacterium sp. TaxID=259322 RepID=UPI00338FE242
MRQTFGCSRKVITGVQQLFGKEIQLEIEAILLASPDLTATHLEELEKGDTIEIVSKDGDFYKVIVNGVEGWISTESLS